MIGKPSTGQLIGAIRDELVEKVIPALDDAVVLDVQMMTSVLDTLAVRCEHEIAWMNDEITAIEQAADALLDQLPSAGDLATAVAALRVANRDQSLHLADVDRRYNLAGEVLSLATEAAYACEHAEAKATVFGLLQDRLVHEQEVVGVFSAVGRG